MTARVPAFVLIVAALVPAAAGAKTSDSSSLDLGRLVSPQFVVSGHGWGHGVGLSQWGAYGYAKSGVAYTKILAHYYPHTTLGPATLRRVRVLLAQNAPSAVIASDGDMRVKDGNGDTHPLAAGSYTLKPGLKLPVGDQAEPQKLVGPLTFIAPSEPLSLGGRDYRGQFEVDVAAGKLQVINVVGLAQYLWGVVPSEVPDDWPAEALKAQAVVARSYALANLQKGGDFDLYSDTRSQVYRGISAEVDSTTSAVNATAGQVVLYNGKVAQTYYFSTSGGRTAAIQDVWPGSPPVPYLVSLPDPYDKASPYHDWAPAAIAPAKLAKALKMTGPVLDVRTTLNASLRVAQVAGVGANGTVGPAIDAADFRTALGLRSTWFTIGELGLMQPTAPVPYGTLFSLTGLARSVGSVTIEQLQAGSKIWTAVSTVAGRSDGTLSVALTPTATTQYRLRTDVVKSKPVTVTVMPMVKMRAATDGTGFVGSSRPVRPGSIVQVQRHSGAGWKPVAAARTDVAGRWRATVDLRAGSYRACLAAGNGLAAGISTVLDLADLP
ncbi:MAG TPA: SpoIID/LytB domain-containing protein [Gaiellaceae bacterium]|nr:SpoIID/LytB domain-containing protein [Gaiellaceae bacterium]